jgi:hypothetical protein
MPILEREEPTHQWGAGNEENEENIPPPTKNKKNAVQFDYKLNRILKTEDLTGNGFRCLSAGQASSGRFKGGIFYNILLFSKFKKKFMQNTIFLMFKKNFA